MDKIVKSTDIDLIFDAVKSGDITLDDVEARFIDLKTSFQHGSQNMAFNDRNKDKKSCWLDLSDDERGQIVGGCSIPVFENPIERWIAYSSHMKYPLMREGSLWNNYGIDCDGSKSAEMVPAAINELYRTLWPNVPADSADTMNSFWTTGKQSLKSMEIVPRHLNTKYSILSAIMDKEGHLLSEFFELEEDHQKAIVEQLMMLAYLTHSIGDFIPCVGLFNRDRYDATFDYWDITLLFIRDWYLNRQAIKFDSDAPDVVFNAGTLSACREWLDYFGYGVEGWNAFVKKNYLDAFMQIRFVPGKRNELAKDETGAYIVQPFFDGHDFDNCLPTNPYDIYITLVNMNAAIIVRGNQMIEALGDDPCVKLFVK